MAGKYDIQIDQGSDLNLVITWKDSLGAEIDLTGYTARLQMRRYASSSSSFLELTTENGGIELGGDAGTITLIADAETTEAITETVGVYDLELTSGSGVVTRILEGAVIINKEVTR